MIIESEKIEKYYLVIAHVVSRDYNLIDELTQ